MTACNARIAVTLRQTCANVASIAGELHTQPVGRLHRDIGLSPSGSFCSLRLELHLHLFAHRTQIENRYAFY